MEDMVLDMKKTAAWLLIMLMLLATMAAGAEETDRPFEGEASSETVQDAEQPLKKPLNWR